MHARIHDPTPAPISVGAAAIERLNAMSVDAQRELFTRCSHSPPWCERMLERGPFANAPALARAAHESWQQVSDEDWLHAFAGHPQIGDVEYLRRRFDTRALGEQGQLLSAPDSVLEELAQLNREYLARHGFIFILCASGLGAVQMLEALRARVHRPTDVEFAEAAAHHAAINRLRLEGALKT